MTSGTTSTLPPAAVAGEADERLSLGEATLCAAFQATAARYPRAVALRTPGGGVEIRWGDYAERVRRLAAGLAALGIGRGDTVAMMVTNRPEALLTDCAATHLGAIPFCVYNTSTPEQIVHLLTNADAGVVATDAQFVDRIMEARSQLPLLREVVVIDGPVTGTRSLAELEAGGAPGFDFDGAWRAVEPSDVATLIYTSGTTGPPKGVELTHDNVMSCLRAIHAIHPLRPQGRMVSWLPLAHLADRIAAHYPSLVTGASVTCVADHREAIAALPEIRPTFFLAVPRIWEKLRAALEPALASEHGAALRTRAASNLGLDDADLVLSGAAPIAPEVLEFFAGLGIEIYEGWGMSETCAGSTLAPKGAHRVGTVGKAIPGVEVKLADDGELLVRGPLVMRGYRKEPEKTAEALDADGWLHTGDIGEIDAEGYVKIVDRKKELIINAAGKNMSPANIENALKAACPLIGSAVAIGDRRPYNTALITLDPDAAQAWAKANGIADTRPAALAADPAIRDLIAAGVKQGNERLSRVEQIKKHALLTDIWEPGGDELTPTMKLRRKPITEKYATEIEAMYS